MTTLKKIRESKDMTPFDVYSKLTRLDKTAYWRYESGKSDITKMPLLTALEIAEILDIEVHELLL